MPKLAGQRTTLAFVAGWLTAAQNWPNSARTSAASCCVLVRAPALVGSTRCMTRCTVTDVAWFRPGQPAGAAAAAGADADAAADDDADAADEDAADADGDVDAAPAGDVPPAPAGAEATTEPHPASAEHSSTAQTVPRTWRGDIMPL